MLLSYFIQFDTYIFFLIYFPQSICDFIVSVYTFVVLYFVLYSFIYPVIFPLHPFVFLSLALLFSPSPFLSSLFTLTFFLFTLPVYLLCPSIYPNTFLPIYPSIYLSIYLFYCSNQSVFSQFPYLLNIIFARLHSFSSLYIFSAHYYQMYLFYSNYQSVYSQFLCVGIVLVPFAVLEYCSIFLHVLSLSLLHFASTIILCLYSSFMY